MRNLDQVKEVIRQNLRQYRFYEKSHLAKLPRLEEKLAGLVGDTRARSDTEEAIEATKEKALANKRLAHKQETALQILEGKITVSDWGWWAGTPTDWCFDLGVANSLEQVLEQAIENTVEKEKFVVVEACMRDDLDHEPDEEEPFALTRNESLYVHSKGGQPLRIYGRWFGVEYRRDEEY